jgi:sodium/potassium-transporting ATPase subunit alpha
VVRDLEHKPLRMPFNSTNKYAFVIVEYETPDSHYCLFTKGAPERIWGLCDKIYSKGKIYDNLLLG